MRKELANNCTMRFMEPRLDGDLRKPQISRCRSGQEILNLLSSVRWEHIRMGISEAAMKKDGSLVPALAYLAKHGWNDVLAAQSKLRNEQLGNIAAILFAERLEQEGVVGRSTIGLAVPRAAMDEIRSSEDPVKTAQEWKNRLNSRENLERMIVKKRAVETLGEIGTPEAIAELAKMLFCTEDNLDMRAASALNRAASENPVKVAPVLKEAMIKFGNVDGTEDVLEVLRVIRDRAEREA